jgi:hypothetical protein
LNTGKGSPLLLWTQFSPLFPDGIAQWKLSTTLNLGQQRDSKEANVLQLTGDILPWSLGDVSYPPTEQLAGDGRGG